MTTRSSKQFISTKNIAVAILTVFSAFIFSTSAFAQKSLVLAEAVDIDQCRNGTAAVPVVCTGSAWVNGSANSTQAHWAENQFIPYRAKITGLTPGPTVNRLTFGFDILKSTKHGIDYLGTFNSTETTANPCSGVSGCTLASPSSTYAIPTDTVTVTSQTNPNTTLPVNQIPGHITMWGGTFVNCPNVLPTPPDPPVFYEPYTPGSDERQITICFTASVSNPVIAWGGHIAWIGDWGVGNSANSIGGNPYHMRLIGLNGSGGNQDLALQAAAVIPSGAVFVKKVVNTLDGTGNAVFAFPFTATANFGTTSFSLIDDNAGPGVDTQQSQAITSFGAGNTITVNEGPGPTGWTLADVNCVESGVQDSTKSPSLGPASIIVQVGEVVTCTFTNTQLIPSASNVSVSGQVLNQFGQPLPNVRVALTDIQGATRTVLTSSFGHYRFDEVESGQVYVISASSKRYTFQSQVLSVGDDISGFDIIAN